MASVPPLVETIAADLGLSNAAMGALTTLPVLCMGVFAPTAQRLAARIGAAGAVEVAGPASRSARDRASSATWWPLYAGTFLAGVGIAGGTLLPGLVKELFPPHRSGLVTGLYMFAMMGGATASSALAVPLEGWLGSWEGSIASWAVLGVVGLLAWYPVARGAGRYRAASPRSRSTTASPGVTPRRGWSRRTSRPSRGSSTPPWPGSRRRTSPRRTPGTRGTCCRRSPSRSWCPGCSGRCSATACTSTGCCCSGLLCAASQGCSGCGWRPVPPRLWAVVLGLGQGASFSLALVIIVDVSATPSASGRLAGMAFLFSYSFASIGPDHGRPAGRDRRLHQCVDVADAGHARAARPEGRLRPGLRQVP